MLYNLSTLNGFGLSASDGEIGSLEDFYFDDDAWVIRYLVVDTGRWLPGRSVLISPRLLGRVNRDNRRVEVRLTKEQIEKSPETDTHKPISRQYETELSDYYGYPYYWGGPFMWGPVAYPAGFMSPPEPVEPDTQTKEVRALRERQRTQDQNLRSTREVTNYYIEASNGEIGHVEDFLIDDRSWAIRYIVIDTRNWWPGKKVLVAPEWISRVSWRDAKAYVDLSHEQIKQAPEYEKDMAVTRDYESRVHQHYNQPGYW
jgi:stress response protein YsnF